jgi:TolA-binding protein
MRNACTVAGAFLLTATLLSTVAFAQEKTEAGTRQYAAAVALQNKGEYKWAADEWNKFIAQFKTDERIDRAYHYLGVCLLKDNRLDEAEKAFATVIKDHPKFDLLEASYLYLGIAQYTAAQGGKAEKYDDAGKTFDALLKQYPESKHVPQALFYRGECSYARGNKKDAATFYSQLVEKHADDKLALDALYALGVTREELGDHAAAAETYDRFLEKYASSPLVTEVVMRRGECDLAAGNVDEAVKRFATAAGKEGFALADFATLRQAESLARQKQFAEAAALYASLPTKFAQSAYIGTARLAGGRAYYQAGDFAAAQTLLADLLAAGGEPALEAAHWTARSLLKEGKPAEALPVLDKAIAAAAESPLTPQLLMDRADATYEIADRRKESVALYADLAAKYPADASAAQALYMAAFAALGAGDFETARKHADAFRQDAKLQSHELIADVMAIAAEANLQLKDYATAETLFAELVAKHASHAEAEAWSVRHGLALYLQKKHQETVDALTPRLPKLAAPAAVAEAQFLIGSSQAELKDFPAAIAALEASLAAAAKWRQADDALLILAHSHYQAKDLEKAKGALKKLIADFPSSRLLDQAHYRLGEYAFVAEDWKGALAEYQKTLDTWPDSPLAPFALYGLGWSKLNTGDHAGAEKTLDALMEKHADHRLAPRGRYARGMARQQLGKFADAAADVKAFLAADPTPAEKADATYVLALCHVGQKQYAEAVTTLEQLLADGPKPNVADKAHYELGWALKSLDREEQAAAAFAKVVELSPDGPLAAECLYHVGENAYRTDDLAKAAESYAASAKKAAKDDLGEKALHKLGWTRFRQNDLAAAEKAFAEQRQRWPQGALAADAAFMQAECLFKQNKYKEAVELYATLKGSSIKDADVLALLHAGQAHGQLKQWDKSLAALTALVEKHPESSLAPEAIYEQGVAQHNLGKPAEAVKLWEEVIGKTGREVAARAQFMIGEVQFEKKEHAEAIKSFFKVSYAYSYPKWQADATYEAGRCFEVLGRADQAMKQYEELVKKFPESDKAALAKERIEALKKG